MKESAKEILWSLSTLILCLGFVAAYFLLGCWWYLLIAIADFFFAIMFGIRAEVNHEH